MNEKISQLMDGELQGIELPGVLTAMKDPDHAAAWACYHAIGDALRGETPRAGYACGLSPAFAARLAAEPTVLAPRRTSVVERTSSWAFAAAATVAAVSVVGWTAYSMLGDTPAAIAKASEAGRLRGGDVRAVAVVPSDYLVAHQEYSPAIALQAVGPYMRAVAVQPGDARQ